MSERNRTNRAIVLTPPGAAGIAVVRLVGSGVEAFLGQRFAKPAILGRCVHGNLSDGQRIIDDPVVVWCEQNIVDLNVHGGSWVVRSVLELAAADGFAVSADEKDAVPDAAVDGTSRIERDVMRWLPLARTPLAVRALLAQPTAWANLRERAQRGEVGRDEVERVLGDQSLHWLLSLPRVAIVGPANVGKSTLANQLFGQERSITADVPGTTRDWVGEVANINGLAVMLVDTPGRRETNDAIERAAIDVSREQVTSADLVLVALDRSASLSAEDQAILASHPDALIVANKSDQPSAWDSGKLRAIDVAAIDGREIDQLRSAILNRFGCDDFKLDQVRCWTAEQRQILGAAQKREGSMAEAISNVIR